MDYAILMTTRYKAERHAGKDEARLPLSPRCSTSIPSIIVSGMGLFAATFGVAVYSDIDIISSMCMLMARGAIVSMLCVILILPALLMLCDRLDVRHDAWHAPLQSFQKTRGEAGCFCPLRIEDRRNEDHDKDRI